MGERERSESADSGWDVKKIDVRNTAKQKERERVDRQKHRDRQRRNYVDRLNSLLPVSDLMHQSVIFRKQER